MQITTNLKELINQADMKKVFGIFVDMVIDADPVPRKNKQEASFEKFEGIIDNIRKTDSISPKDGSVIVVAKVRDSIKDNKYRYEVVGIKPNNRARYDLLFSSWSAWLGYGVLNNSIETYGMEDVVAAILWEMLFFGSDSDTHSKKSEEIIQSLNSAELETEKRITMDEIREKFGMPKDTRSEAEKDANSRKMAAMVAENEKIYEELLSEN